MRILVVDDEELIAAILREHLEGQGHDVEVAANGLVAAQLWTDLDFDVLVSDIKLPGLSGVELLAKIRADGDTQPCLLLSGHVDDAKLDSQPQLQPAAMLAKPFSFAQFDAMLEPLCRSGDATPPP